MRHYSKKHIHIFNRISEFYRDLYTGKETLPAASTTRPNPVPEIMKYEVDHAINSIKNNRAAGQDGLVIEVIKSGGDALKDAITNLLNMCLEQNVIPKQWCQSQMIIIHKKGSKTDLRNYRPISLLPHIYKILEKVICNRIQNKLDENQPREQAGFRSGYSTSDHLHTIQQLLEKCNEYKKPLIICFVDYEKAFDSVETSKLIEALEKQGIDSCYTEILKKIYNSSTTTIELDNLSKDIPISKGVRQGGILSPKLFNAALEEVFKNLNWQAKGINIDGEQLHDLRFADDCTLITDNDSELNEMLTELSTEGAKAGLKINIPKTEVLRNKYEEKNNDIMLEGITLKEVENFVYLGKAQSADNSLKEEINRRIKHGWVKMSNLKSIMKSKFPQSLKAKVYNQCVIPAMVYGSETWSLTNETASKLRTAQHGMERQMLGITKWDRKKLSWIRSKSRVNDVVAEAVKRKWNWAGHLARLPNYRWAKRITEWYPRDGKRERRRPNRRWADDIKKIAGHNWLRLARDRTAWKSSGEAFIQQWIENLAD